eukprot:5163773-Pyramimonas_sp.AAC.1
MSSPSSAPIHRRGVGCGRARLRILELSVSCFRSAMQDWIGHGVLTLASLGTVPRPPQRRLARGRALEGPDAFNDVTTVITPKVSAEKEGVNMIAENPEFYEVPKRGMVPSGGAWTTPRNSPTRKAS